MKARKNTKWKEFMMGGKTYRGVLRNGYGVHSISFQTFYSDI